MHNKNNNTAKHRWVTWLRLILVVKAALLVGACAGQSNVDLSKGHVFEEPPVPGETPEIVAARPEVPEPVRVPPAPTYFCLLPVMAVCWHQVVFCWP